MSDTVRCTARTLTVPIATRRHNPHNQFIYGAHSMVNYSRSQMKFGLTYLNFNKTDFNKKFLGYEITKFNEIGKSIHTHYVLFTVRKYCFPNDKK